MEDGSILRLRSETVDLVERQTGWELGPSEDDKVTDTFEEETVSLETAEDEGPGCGW